jgi:cytochrome c553
MKYRMLAAAMAALFASPVSASDPAAVPAGELYSTFCSACHGRTGRGVSAYPSLSGQTEDYLSDRLMTYRAGERIGPNSMLMIPMAADLTDEDIAGLATFISTTFR